MKLVLFNPISIRTNISRPKSNRFFPEAVRITEPEIIFCKGESEIRPFSSLLYQQQYMGSQISPYLSGIRPEYKI